jgi:hypothetical protein
MLSESHLLYLTDRNDNGIDIFEIGTPTGGDRRARRAGAREAQHWPDRDAGDQKPARPGVWTPILLVDAAFTTADGVRARCRCWVPRIAPTPWRSVLVWGSSRRVALRSLTTAHPAQLPAGKGRFKLLG